jgi:phosphoribosyl-ATP pyrophosphohydrolase/phosphoribosyl-AMP cyclohydrolase
MSVRALDPAAVRFGPDGLVAAVVQDAADGRVLMVGWQDAEALDATLRTGEAHFHSRSRGTLWRKGETSGNTLAIESLELDCDGDAVLIRARPAGPTCHTGARSCFDEGADPGAGRTPQGFAWLETLWSTIAERAATRPEGSYTASLLAGGTDAVARKVAEEATEVVLAAKDDAFAERAGAPRDRDALAGELADLLYHAFVLCAERGLEPGAVTAILRARHAA